MTSLEKLIVSRAELDASLLIKKAKSKRRSEISKAKKELEGLYKRELELAKKRAEGESSVKAGELHTKFNKWRLSKETKVFLGLRSSLIDKLKKSPKKLFSKVIRQGRREFEKPSVIVEPDLKGLFKGAVVDKNVKGVRVGQDKIYISAEIEDVVDMYLEKNYSLILGKLFGGKK